MFELRQIKSGDNLAGLSLGDEKYIPLKIFVRKHALVFHEQHLAKTYAVFKQSTNKQKFVAYITLVCGEIVVEEGASILPASIPFTYKSIPAVKIARLAVDKRYRKMDIGKGLVDFALGLIKDVICPTIGCRFAVVDSKLDSVPFYTKCGFTIIDTAENKTRNEPVMFVDLWKIISEVPVGETISCGRQ